MGCFLSKSVENGIQIMPIYITVNVYIVTKKRGYCTSEEEVFSTDHGHGNGIVHGCMRKFK